MVKMCSTIIAGIQRNAQMHMLVCKLYFRTLELQGATPGEVVHDHLILALLVNILVFRSNSLKQVYGNSSLTRIVATRVSSTKERRVREIVDAPSSRARRAASDEADCMASSHVRVPSFTMPRTQSATAVSYVPSVDPS